MEAAKAAVGVVAVGTEDMRYRAFAVVDTHYKAAAVAAVVGKGQRMGLAVAAEKNEVSKMAELEVPVAGNSFLLAAANSLTENQMDWSYP